MKNLSLSKILLWLLTLISLYIVFTSYSPKSGFKTPEELYTIIGILGGSFLVLNLLMPFIARKPIDIGLLGTSIYMILISFKSNILTLIGILIMMTGFIIQMKIDLHKKKETFTKQKTY